MRRANRNHHWGVILAGGEGQRLSPVTRMVSGDDRPKQFCALLPGGRTLLQQTQVRISKAIEPARVVVVLNSRHERFYADLFANVPPGRMAVQPENRGTFGAVLYGLSRVIRQDPEAVVGFLPPDHQYIRENRFLAGLEAAFAAAESNANRVILLGAKARYPDTNYGYIEPQGGFRDFDHRIRAVARFWEKPGESIARDLVDRGCLWNTFVMVGRAQAFLDLVRSAAPGLYGAFDPIFSNPQPELEAEILASIYRRIPSADFSKSVLSAAVSRLAVLTLGDIGWTDSGAPRRVLETLFSHPVRCAWTPA